MSNLQQKLESVQTAHTLMREDLQIANSNIVELQRENSELGEVKEQLLSKHTKQIEV